MDAGKGHRNTGLYIVLASLVGVTLMAVLLLSRVHVFVAVPRAAAPTRVASGTSAFLTIVDSTCYHERSMMWCDGEARNAGRVSVSYAQASVILYDSRTQIVQTKMFYLQPTEMAIGGHATWHIPFEAQGGETTYKVSLAADGSVIASDTGRVR
jgi:hypothetical protein